MISNILIKGAIGNCSEPIQTTYIDVVKQVQKVTTSATTGYNIFIDSPGGLIDVGYDIYDFLKSLNNVTTIIDGQCASIATVIVMAGTQRLITPNSTFLIHNPWAANVNGDADELQLASDQIREEENKLITFYNKITKISKVALDALMKKETSFNPQEAIELGFLTGIYGDTTNTTEIVENKYKALALINLNTTNKINNMTILEKLDALMNLVKGKKDITMLGFSLTTADGFAVEVTPADGIEDNLAEVGDSITVDGKVPADNTPILLADGSSVETVAGVIATATPAATAQVEELPAEDATAIKKELEDSKALIEDLKKEIEASKNQNSLVETKLALFEKSLKSITSKGLEVEETVQVFGKLKTEEKDFKTEMEERRNLYKTKK